MTAATPPVENRSPLPPGWRWARLGDLFDIQQGVAMSPARRHGTPLRPFLRTINIVWGGVDLSVLDRMHFTDQEVARLCLKEGDLLVCEGGDVGRTGIWRGQLDVCLYQNHVHRLRVRDSDVVPEVYMYWMQAAMQLGVYAGQWGETTIANLSSSRLSSFQVPLPPLPEQRRIAAVLSEQLDAVRRARAAALARLEAARALPAAFLRALFDSDEAQHWPRVGLGEIAAVNYGLTKDPIRSAGPNQIPYLRVANVQESWVDTDDILTLHVDPAEYDNVLLRPGDLLFTEGNSKKLVGRCALWHGQVDPCSHQNHILRARVHEGVGLPEFLFFYARSPVGRSYFFSVAKQTTGIATMNSTQLRNFEVPWPDMATQESAVRALQSHMAAISETRRHAEAELAAIDALPHALLRRAFAGEL